MWLYDRGVLLYDRGVLLYDRGVLLYDRGVLLYDRGVECVYIIEDGYMAVTFSWSLCLPCSLSLYSSIIISVSMYFYIYCVVTKQYKTI